MKIYETTGIKCPICNSELRVVEDRSTTEVDGEIYKDVEHYFECPNDCDYDFEEMDNCQEEIERILTKELELEMQIFNRKERR